MLMPVLHRCNHYFQWRSLTCLSSALIFHVSSPRYLDFFFFFFLVIWSLERLIIIPNKTLDFVSGGEKKIVSDQSKAVTKENFSIFRVFLLLDR